MKAHFARWYSTEVLDQGLEVANIRIDLRALVLSPCMETGSLQQCHL